MSFHNLNRLLSSQEGPYVEPLTSENIRVPRGETSYTSVNATDDPSPAGRAKIRNEQVTEGKKSTRPQPIIDRRQFLGALIPVSKFASS